MQIDDAMDEDILRVRRTQVCSENMQSLGIGTVGVIESGRVDQVHLVAIELEVENANI